MLTSRIRERNFIRIFFPQAHLVQLVFPFCALQHIVDGFVHATLGEHGNCFSCKLDLPKVAYNHSIASLTIDLDFDAASFFNLLLYFSAFANQDTYPLLWDLDRVLEAHYFVSPLIFFTT